MSSFWSPIEKSGRAALTFVGHSVVAVVALTCVWGIERYMAWLWPDQEPMLFGVFPLKYAFQASEAISLISFIVLGIIEAYRAAKE